MPTILESVKVDLDEDEIRRLIDAVEHYEALHALTTAGREQVSGTSD